MGDGASGAGLDVVRDGLGARVLLDGFAGLVDLGDAFEALEDGGLLIEPARKSPLVLNIRWWPTPAERPAVGGGGGFWTIPKSFQE